MLESNKRSALLLALMGQLKESGSWCGETHVQKAAYFLQSLARVELGLDFILYKHGPFSFDLREELSHMRANRLIDLVPALPYGPRFQTSEIGKSLLERFPKTVSRHGGALRFVAEKLGDRNVAELEKLATALLVIQEEPEIEKGAEKLHSIKPHINSKSAAEAIQQVLDWTSDYQEI